MSNIDKRGLREAAEKATKGRWAVEFDDEIYSTDGVNHEQIAMVFSENEARDAAFIAAANPATVLAMLDELESAEKRIAEQQSAIIAPGIMRCAGCGFVLTKNSINMAAGTITAGDSKTEPCPNGCGPLWPVTWKEQALQMRDDSEQWFIELQQAKNRIAELEGGAFNPAILDV
ncbi:TPA: ead/Ea22-like family protein, partial [Escherichia coli]